MEAILLGNNGRTATRLGLGLAALGRPGYINLGHGKDLAGNYDVEAMEARAHAVLDAAWEIGIPVCCCMRFKKRVTALTVIGAASPFSAMRKSLLMTSFPLPGVSCSGAGIQWMSVAPGDSRQGTSIIDSSRATVMRIRI